MQDPQIFFDGWAKLGSVVLETDGTFSVVWRKTGGDSSSMSDVPGHPAERPDSGSDAGDAAALSLRGEERHEVEDR